MKVALPPRVTWLCVVLVALAVPAATRAEEPPRVVAFRDPEAAVRLGRSRHSVDFFRLAKEFEGQQNVGYCGPATAVIVLNALRADNAQIAKPRDGTAFPAEYRSRLPPGLDPVPARYTQRTFFDEKTEQVKPRDQFFGAPKKPGDKPSPGLELRQLHEILRAHGLASDIRVVNDARTDDAIRKDLSRNLATGGDFVVINYLRPALGQKGGGHISPLGAYDEVSDSFLILDVNPNGNDWAWVPTALLAKAMRTRDVSENRGYLLLREAGTPAAR